MALAAELSTAIAMARRAGEVVLSMQNAGLTVDRKLGNEPVTEADRRASAIIVEGLTAAFPDDAVLSEEAEDDLQRLSRARVWMIDPIDGTSDFIRGEDGFSTMIGLCLGDQPVLGVVYQSRGDRLYRAVHGEGAFVEDAAGARRLAVSDVAELTALRMVASRSHRDESITRVKQSLGVTDELNVGSVGLKLGLIARGDRDVYVTLTGRSKLWDTLGPQVILHEAGGRLTDARGRAIEYRGRELANKHGLVASNGRIHDRIVDKIAPIVAAIPADG